MRLYCTPGGTWAGTEKDWKNAVKAEGLDPKTIERRQVEVPTAKAELLEFLTFHHVNAMGPSKVETSTAVVPQAPPLAPLAPVPAGDTAPTTVSNLNELFDAAPLRLQLDLAVAAIDRASERLTNGG